MSPFLFTLYVEEMMGETMGDIVDGIHIGGFQFKDVRFADDQEILASTEKGFLRI